MKNSILSILFAGITFFAAQAKDEHVSELKDGVLALSSGDYQATFSFGHRWNLSALTYQGASILSVGGANQFTLKERKENGEETWYGGIGRDEEIKSIILYVDDEPFSLPPDGPGDNKRFNLDSTYVLEKISKMGPYEVTLRTTVSPSGISEKLSFFAEEETDTVDFIYPSRFSFEGTFVKWFAVLRDGFEEEGEIPGGKENQVYMNFWTESLALYDESRSLVALLRTTEEPQDVKQTHFVWDTANKKFFHAKMDAVSKDAGQIVISRELVVWNSQEDPEDWQQQVRKYMTEK